jgi:hypothetical protein
VVVGRRFEVFVKRVETLRGRVKWGDGLENGKVRVSQFQSRYTTNHSGFKEVAVAFPVRNALRLVAVAELADVGARREPPPPGLLHCGV